MDEPITINTILGFLKEAVQEKRPLPPSVWLDSATKLMVLLEDLDEEWVEAKMAVLEQKAALIQTEGHSAATAKAIVEGSPHYRKWLELDTKRERIREYVLLCKKRVGLPNWD